MRFFLIGFLIHLFIHGYCKADVHIGYQAIVEVPMVYSVGFIGRAFLMETTTNRMSPSFKAALSVEALNGEYTCSLEVFLGDVKVWNSGHLWKFYTTDICMIELTDDGDLRLKGSKVRVGWRTGTTGQGVQRLQLLRTGNLVLFDELNFIRWQSFNFPTDVMLWGQRLDVATRLTSFTASRNSTSTFYSFEIQYNKIGLYLNSGKLKYSYWEFKPSNSRNITFIELGSRGLELFNEKYKKIAQIPSQKQEQPLRFLALGNITGNLGLYYYSPEKGKFESSFQALNTTCDLPLACKPYGICTFSNSCSCIRLLTSENKMGSDCNGGDDEETSGKFCGRGQVELLELEGVTSVLRNEPKRKKVNVTSKQVCMNMCINDCKYVAALYSSGEKGDTNSQECFLYELVRGVKQVEKGSGLSYFIKVPKGTKEGHGKSSNAKRWVLILVGVVDCFILFFVMGGIVYYVIRKRRKNLSTTIDNNN